MPQERLSFANRRPGAQLAQTIDLVAGKAGVAVSVQQVTFDRPGISYESEPIVVEGLQGHRFRFRLGLDVAIGAFHTRATVTFLVGEEQFQASVPISGGVIADIAVLPRLLVTLDAVAAGEAIPFGRVTLRSIDQSKKFEILQVDAGAHLRYTVSHDQERAGWVYHLDFRVDEHAPPGPFAQPITILTNSRDQPMITIPAYIAVASKVEVKPPGVYLRNTGGEEAQAVKLHCATCRGFKIEGASSNNPHVLVAVINNPAEEHRQQAVVSLAKSAPPGQHHAEVTVHTNAQGAELIKLRVIADVSDTVPAVGQP